MRGVVFAMWQNFTLLAGQSQSLSLRGMPPLVFARNFVTKQSQLPPVFARLVLNKVKELAEAISVGTWWCGYDREGKPPLFLYREQVFDGYLTQFLVAHTGTGIQNFDSYNVATGV